MSDQNSQRCAGKSLFSGVISYGVDFKEMIGIIIVSADLLEKSQRDSTAFLQLLQKKYEEFMKDTGEAFAETIFVNTPKLVVVGECGRNPVAILDELVERYGPDPIDTSDYPRNRHERRAGWKGRKKQHERYYSEFQKRQDRALSRNQSSRWELLHKYKVQGRIRNNSKRERKRDNISWNRHRANICGE